MISNTNYESHKDEVELLKNILFEQMTTLEEEPNFILEINIVPDCVEEPKLDFIIKFTLTDEYPYGSPLYEINDNSNYLASSKIKSLCDVIKTFVEENHGMPMIYQIYEMVKDFVNEQELIMHQEQQDKINLEEEKLRKYNEKIAQMEKSLIETRTFTPVTKENYENWFKKFYAASLKGKEKKLEQDARMSGREYFMNLKNNPKGLDGDESEEGDVEEEVENESELKKEEAVVFDAQAFEENLDDIDFDQDFIDDI
jgi:hypothetical protein